MHGSKWWLVCYDVRDPDRLRKCAKRMEGYGRRIQYSVFRCWMNDREMERLRWELTELLHTDDDVILMPLCSTCVRGIVGIYDEGRSADWPEEPPRHTIV